VLGWIGLRDETRKEARESLAALLKSGVRRIAKVTQSLVPAMALLYLVLGLVIVGMNITEVPRVLGEIYAGAFGFQQVAGGAIGTIIMQGVKRGMFSNEAGLGSAPNAGASAAVTHPLVPSLPPLPPGGAGCEHGTSWRAG
jgi:AGCS family alanine or glycine:cation symporter